MEENRRMSALEAALQNEMNEREFYLTHAGRTRNPVGRAMFERIADDELEHYQRLNELHEVWLKKGKWPETIPLTVKNAGMKSLLSGLIRQVEGNPEADADDLDAIGIAAAFESRGHEKYLDLSRSVSDPKEKAFFELLAGMEREHYLSLKDMEEYLRDPASWFTRQERHGLDGG